MRIHCILPGGLLVLGSLASNPARAQRSPQISGSVGVSLTAASLGASTVPPGFGAGGSFQLAAQLRVLYPLAPHLGLSVAQHITGLSPMLHYRSGYGRLGSGFGSGGLLHTSVGVQYLDVVSWGPRWHVDAGLSLGYGYQLNRFLIDENWRFAAGAGATSWPEPDQPLVLLHTQYPRRWTPLLGASLQVQYAFTKRQFVLISLDYQRGLLPLAEISTRRLEYLDEAGVTQSGNLTVRHRGSYVTAQLGYGWQLGSPARRTTPRTPRYGRLPAVATEPEPEAPPVYFEPTEE